VAEPSRAKRKRTVVIGVVAIVVIGGAVLWAVTVGGVLGGGHVSEKGAGAHLPPGTEAAVEFHYLNDHVTVKAGDPLVFENRGTADHTFTADDGRFDSGIVHPGGTYRVALDGPRQIEVHCEIHPSMRAQVTVLAP
jgi:plastocyanin